MSGGHDIRACGVDLRVNRECRSIHRILSFHHLASVIHQNQIGDANLAEMHAEGIDPKMIEPFRVAGRDVAGHSFVESEARKKAERAGQALLAMQALFGQSAELRRCR